MFASRFGFMERAYWADQKTLRSEGGHRKTNFTMIDNGKNRDRLWDIVHNDVLCG